MARVNVNTATREELLEVGGLRPEIADEILKLRRKEEITGPETLDQVPGVGPATLEQLKKVLDFSSHPKGGGDGDDRAQGDERRGAAQPARAMAEAARGATRAGAEAAETGVGDGLRVVQRAAEVECTVAHRAAEGATELGRVLVDLLSQQTRHNLETWAALGEAIDWSRAARAVDWDRVLQLQGEYLRLSLERATELTRRYLEVSQAMVTAATDAIRDQEPNQKAA